MKWRMTDIENFVETAVCSTIIQAAKKLEISQPALSESIKRLEQDADVQLFYRSRSGIQLTPSGRTFLVKAKALLEKVHDLDLKKTEGDIFHGQSITIGCHSTVARYSIPQALRFLEEKAPDYQIHLKHDLSRNIQAEIQRGVIDIGLVINPVPVPDLVILKIAQDHVRVWQAKGGSDQSIICNPDLFQTQSILKKWKAKPRRIISTESLELICQIVDAGAGYGILPERAVKLSGFPLKAVPSLPSFRDEIALVFRPEFGKSIPEKLVIEALKNGLEK